MIFSILHFSLRKEVIIIKRLIFFLGSLFILCGCTDAKIVVPIHEYAEPPAEEEIIENVGEEIDNERNIPETPNQAIDAYSEAGVIGSIRDGACWNESVEEDCTLTLENPREIIEKEPTLNAPLSVDKGEELDIIISLANEEFSDSIYPYQVEIIQFEFHDEEGKFIDSELKRREIKFLAPNEKGLYYYLLHVIWTEDKTKRAYYAFPINVR